MCVTGKRKDTVKRIRRAGLGICTMSIVQMGAEQQLRYVTPKLGLIELHMLGVKDLGVSELAWPKNFARAVVV